MSKKKSLFLSLSLVLIVGLSIVAGTFAYFQWQAATGTQVNVTIEMGGITMNIEPEETEFVGLYPTAHCINNVRYGDALVTIENKTGALAIPSFKLKVAVNPSTLDTGKLNDYKDNIHYAVVALETNKDGSKKLSNGNVITVGGNTIDELVTGTCSAPLNVSNTTDNDNTFKSDYGKVATGLFDVITAEKTFADTPFLPREYNSTTGKVQGVTFRGEAYSISYQWYRVYVWIDENYTTTIIGNDVTDPLQNAQISVTWSENSMLQQVSGESIVDNEPTLDAGLYDLDNNMVKTWDELLNDGDITLDGTIIENSNKDLTGALVIPEGITEIGDSAFAQAGLTNIEIPASVTTIGDWAFDYSVSLKEVTFMKNSQLTTIGKDAFNTTSFRSIIIPASVTTIGDSAFMHSLLNEISYEGTVDEWNLIVKGNDWNKDAPSVLVKCTDGVVTIREAGLYDSYRTLTKTWQELLDDGDITVVNNVITDSNRELTGELIIPEGITSIGFASFGGEEFYANFHGVSLLNSVYIPSSVTSVGDSAFIEMTSLISVTFAPGSQLTEIGDYAFAATNIRNIEIPSSVTIIGDSAFAAMPLTNIEISKNVEIIKNYAFSGCESLETIIFRGNISEWNAITKGESWNSIVPATEVICSDGTVALE